MNQTHTNCLWEGSFLPVNSHYSYSHQYLLTHQTCLNEDTLKRQILDPIQKLLENMNSPNTSRDVNSNSNGNSNSNSNSISQNSDDPNGPIKIVFDLSSLSSKDNNEDKINNINNISENFQDLTLDQIEAASNTNDKEVNKDNVVLNLMKKLKKCKNTGNLIKKSDINCESCDWKQFNN